jgi:hypothetical protein
MVLCHRWAGGKLFMAGLGSPQRVCMKAFQSVGRSWVTKLRALARVSSPIVPWKSVSGGIAGSLITVIWRQHHRGLSASHSPVFNLPAPMPFFSPAPADFILFALFPVFSGQAPFSGGMQVSIVTFARLLVTCNRSRWRKSKSGQAPGRRLPALKPGLGYGSTASTPQRKVSSQSAQWPRRSRAGLPTR